MHVEGGKAMGKDGVVGNSPGGWWTEAGWVKMCSGAI